MEGERFAGLSHEEALAAALPEISCLVEETIEAASLGALLGLPEVGKSVLGQQLAFGVASGRRVVGQRVVRPGPVGMWLQDGSRARTLERMHVTR
jgi:AAA domain